jgi:hypothetical protein
MKNNTHHEELEEYEEKAIKLPGFVFFMFFVVGR